MASNADHVDFQLRRINTSFLNVWRQGRSGRIYQTTGLRGVTNSVVSVVSKTGMPQCWKHKTRRKQNLFLWLLWKSRNERIFEGFSRSVQHICSYGEIFLRDYQLMHSKEMASMIYQPHQDFDSRWKPPSEDHLKLNVDASFSVCGAGVGMIVRNYAGEVEVIAGEKLSQCCDAEHAEVLGFLKAVELAHEYGISHLELEGDALGVVKKINSTSVDLSSIGHLIDRIRDLLKQFPSVKVSYVKRNLINQPMKFQNWLYLCRAE